MPALRNAPGYSEHQDDSPSVANDNAEAARGFETIPQPIGWKATAGLVGSAAMAALFTLCLLLLAIG
jgi:hypothetical protein